MSKNFKWSIEPFNKQPINVVLFVSRNKDNEHIENFKERRKAFITHEPMSSENLNKEFKAFVKNGVNGEFSRMYYSINERDGEKIYHTLLHFLIDNPDFNLCSIQSKLAGIAADKANAKTKHWMFDFDVNDIYKAEEFVKDIKEIDDTLNPRILSTPHAFAIIVEHGFDTRTLFEKWNEDITLKRDDLLCINWGWSGDLLS